MGALRLLENARIENVDRLEDSLVGRFVRNKEPWESSGLPLMIGDDSEVLSDAVFAFHANSIHRSRYRVEPRVFPDERGFFLETTSKSDLCGAWHYRCFRPGQFSARRKALCAGLHYQKVPKEQGKLVRETGGEIFDVVVDIRKGSPAMAIGWQSHSLNKPEDALRAARFRTAFAS